MAGVAAVVLLALAVLLYGPWPIPIDRLLPVSLPRHFWLLLAIILSVGAIGCLSIWERGLPERARPLSARPARVAPPASTETRAKAVAVGGAEPAGPLLPAGPSMEIPASPPSPAVAAPAGPELPRILEWLKAVEAEIAAWTVEVAESMAPEPIVEEPGPSRLEVSEDPEASQAGAWTELKARAAIEKYLRKRPWAPASDIAKALGMGLGLATRVMASVREERGSG